MASSTPNESAPFVTKAFTTGATAIMVDPGPAPNTKTLILTNREAAGGNSVLVAVGDLLTGVTTYTTGTAAFSGNTATGTGTTWAASMVGMAIRSSLSAEWHIITAFNSPTSLTIFPSAPVIASAAYTIQIWNPPTLTSATSLVIPATETRVLELGPEGDRSSLTTDGLAANGIKWPTPPPAGDTRYVLWLQAAAGTPTLGVTFVQCGGMKLP